MDSDPDLSPLPLFGDIFLDLLATAPGGYQGIVPIVICFLLLCLSAVVSGSEVALFSIKPTDLDALNQSKNKSDKLIARLLTQPRQLLSTILISNSIINVLLVIIASRLIQSQIQLVDLQGELWGIAKQDILEFALITVGVTSLLVLLGEVTPKSLAHQRNLDFAQSLVDFYLLHAFYSGPLLWCFLKVVYGLKKEWFQKILRLTEMK